MSLEDEDKKEIEGETGTEGGEGTEGLDEARMSLLEHLQELRLRLRNAAIAFIVALFASFYFIEDFFYYLTRPILIAMQELGLPPTFYTSGIGTGFWTFFKLSIIVAILAASPLIFWEIWKFVAPGLYKKEKKLALTVTAATAICFIGGSLFGYQMLSKTTCLYLLGIAKKAEDAKKIEADNATAAAAKPPAPDRVPIPAPAPLVPPPPQKAERVELTKGAMAILPLPHMDEVMDFQVMMLLGCGASFELPVVLAILGWIGLISARGLWKFNKYALILSAVVGGVLTPSPDAISQLMLAGPLYILYNVSIIIVWGIERGRKKEQDALEKQWAEEDERDKSASA